MEKNNNSYIHSSYNSKYLRKVFSKIPHTENLVYPIFVSEEPNEIREIQGFPNQKIYGYKSIIDFLLPLVKNGNSSIVRLKYY